VEKFSHLTIATKHFLSMKNPFLLAPFLLAIFFVNSLSAQNQGPLVITGVVYPGCGCSGGIDLTATSNIPSNPAVDFAYFWSNGTTTQDIFNLCPGSYCVTVTSINGLTDTACFFVPEIPYTPLDILSSNRAPCNFDSLAIDSECEKVCPGTTVTYSVAYTPVAGGTSSFVSWQVTGASSWSVNGTPPFSNSVTVTWGSPGVGSVSVFSDGSINNCSGESYLCVTVIEAPEADFTSSPSATAGGTLQVCKGQTVNFQNTSTGDVDSYEWLFSDDLSSTSVTDPQHTYLTAGMHTVRLIARSSCLCADTTEMSIEVLDAEAPTLDCVGTICPGTTVTYTNSNGCAPFIWTVSPNGNVLSGGTTSSDSITVEWGNGPVGTISLGAQACAGVGCPLAGITEVPIISDNAEIRGETRVCPGVVEVYSIEAFGGSGFVWTLPTGGYIQEGQGTNRVKVQWNSAPNPSTSHLLSVEYDNCYLGCGGQDDIAVRILSPFALSGPVEECENSDGTFTSKLTSPVQNLNCNWSLTAPDGSTAWTSASATASANVPFANGAGLYRLFATPADLNQTCSNSADWAIKVPDLPTEPTGILGEKNICPGTTYTYEADGLPAGANVRWTLKNGAAAPQTLAGNPLNVTWGAAGPYWLSVAQVSADGLGCLSDTVGLLAAAIAPPTLAGAPLVCESTKGNYAVQNFQNVDIQWSISPASAGSVANGQGSNAVEIFWNQPGIHTLNVSVCGQNAFLPVTVLPNPDPVVQHPAGLCPGDVSLLQTTLPFSNFVWKDGTGATVSTGGNPILGAGNYAVEVVDANGCRGAKEFEIESWDAPDVSLTTADPTGFCNNSYTVTLTSLRNPDANYTYQWFRDGGLLPGAVNATLATNQYGNYTVQATNSFGCTATAGPILLFEYCVLGGSGVCSVCSGGGQLCPPGTVQAVPDPTGRCDSFALVLNDYSGLYIPGSAEWRTGISGGALIGTATGDNASFVYPNAGKYIVVVRVQLSNGLVCDALDSLDVEAVARFDELIGCPGEMTDFQNVSEFLPESGITNYAWDFGDSGSGAANFSNMEDPSKVFSPAGNYTVQLTVTAASGCTSSASKVVEIPSTVVPTFADPAQKCAGNALEFATPSDPNIVKIEWDFGDPASGVANDATGISAYHKFSTGTYTVTATATNVHGCTATFARAVTTVPNTLVGNISPAAPAPICEGASLNLTAPAGAVLYQWSDQNSTTTPTLLVNEEGSYQVTLTDANGCTYVPPAAKIEVNPAPDALIKGLLFNDLNQIVGVSYPTLTVCAGEDVVLQGISNGLASYAWSGGNGTNSSLYFTEDRGALLPVGNHLYTVTVTNPLTGCTAVSDPFLATVNPKPSGFSISSASYCAGDPNTLTYTGPSPANWQFFWNTGESGTSLTTEESGTYYIRVVNEFGCEAKSNTVAILPGPPVGSIPAGCHTRCKPDTLCLPNLPNVASWQWYMNGNPVPGATTPNFIAQQSGTYWAELTDWYGCSATSDPLSLELFDGYGNILGQVWSDVNANGLIDAADTLLSGITVVSYQNGALFGSNISGAAGEFALTNVLSTNYTFSVDPFSLPPNWTIIIGQDAAALSGCDVEANCEFLLRFGCQAFSTLQLSACAGETVAYNGQNIPAGGTQIFQMTSPEGCDSTVVVNVTALQPSSSALTLNACPGEMATYNGASLAIGATQSFTLQNWQGCDSIVTVTVGSLASSNTNLQVGVCPGETYEYQGVVLAAGTMQTFTLTNAVGCDSVVTINVRQKNVSSNLVEVSVCPNETYTYAGEEIAPGDSQEFHFNNWEGCDSTVTVAVSAFPEVNFGLVAKPSCTNAATGVLEAVGIAGGLAPLRFSLDNVDFQDSARFVGLSAGGYTLHIEDGNGCVFARDTTLTALIPLEIELLDGILPCDSAGVRLEAIVLRGDTTGINFNWWNGARTPFSMATDAGPVWVEVTDQCGTQRSEASVEWAELAKDLGIVYVPNVFMPSANDAANASFAPRFSPSITLLNYHFEVFDRWGNKLFETSNTADAWVGDFRSQTFKPGVQVWHLEADIAVCGRILKIRRNGDVTVVR
jgi:PKD repeat protein